MVKHLSWLEKQLIHHNQKNRPVIGGAMKSEEASQGALYSISENVTVNLPQSELGVGQFAKTLVGNIEDAKVEKVISRPI